MEASSRSAGTRSLGMAQGRPLQHAQRHTRPCEPTPINRGPVFYQKNPSLVLWCRHQGSGHHCEHDNHWRNHSPRSRPRLILALTWGMSAYLPVGENNTALFHFPVLCSMWAVQGGRLRKALEVSVGWAWGVWTPLPYSTVLICVTLLVQITQEKNL